MKKFMTGSSIVTGLLHDWYIVLGSMLARVCWGFQEI
jgi:hypothetical protein